MRRDANVGMQNMRTVGMQRAGSQSRTLGKLTTPPGSREIGIPRAQVICATREAFAVGGVHVR
eukprot:2831906-Heterocapsa_arctica.AAC.1